MSTIIRAAEATVGLEVVIHGPLADEFRDHYVTITDTDEDGFAVVLEVVDRTGRTGTLSVAADTACTVYGPPTRGFPPIHTSVLDALVNGTARS